MSAEPEPWQWDEPTWREIVGKVRAGRSLHPQHWPGGARVAVAISFDSDHETPALRDGLVTPGALSGGEYSARVAQPRILALLERHRVPASFFVPAVAALLHPETVRDARAAGHEIGAHGWIHERNTLLAEADERELALRALDTLEQLAGERPVGIRTPSWDFSPHTLSIIAETGLAYDSSLMADDEPYELLADGAPTGIVEIPVEWIRDDMPYFGFSRYAGARPHSAPRAVLDIWRDEFAGALADGGLFQLTLHPGVSGHRSRLWILDTLLGEIAATDGVWFATHAQVAAHVLAADGSR